MVVAVLAVLVMQVPGDEVIGVVAVRNGFVTAAVFVTVIGGVGCAVVRRAGLCRLRVREHVLVDVVAMRTVQVTVVEIVDVVLMAKRGVSAALAVLVVVSRMRLVRDAIAASTISGAETAKSAR